MCNDYNELKATIDFYKKNYIKKDYLVQIIEKLQESFNLLELDASSIHKFLISLKSNKNNLDESSNSRINEELIQNSLLNALN